MYEQSRLGVLDAANGEQESHHAYALWGGPGVGGYSYRGGGTVRGRADNWILHRGQASTFGFGNEAGVVPSSYWFEEMGAATAVGEELVVVGSRYRIFHQPDGSVRYDSRAFFWTAGQNTLLQPQDNRYVSASGHRGDRAIGVLGSGQIFGSSQIFQGDQPIGADAWMYHRGQFEFISNFDALNPPPLARPDGGTSHEIVGQLANGALVGNSQVSGGLAGSPSGATAWVRSGGVYAPLGLSGQEYVRPDGSTASSAVSISGNEVLGTSYVVTEPSAYKFTSWLYSGGVYRTPIKPGGTDSRASAAIAGKLPDGRLLTVVGRQLDHAAYIDDGVSIVRIDPQETRFVSLFGVREFYAGVHDSGLVTGRSSIPHPRANGYSEVVGGASWMWRDGELRMPELRDPIYLDDTYGVVASDSYLTDNNRSGDAVGFSRVLGIPAPDPRPDDFNGYGQSGWFYQWHTDTTTPLVFSIAENGRRSTLMFDLAEGGSALGAYELFAGNESLGYVPFLWSMDMGMVPLETLVAGGLPRFGDDLNASMLDDGSILLSGAPYGSQDSVALLLTVTIPEPQVLAMAALPLLALRRRR